MEFLKKKIVAVALSASATIAVLSFISPMGLDFMFDLVNIGLIALVAKLHKTIK